MPRNYKQEYARYQGTPEQKKNVQCVIKQVRQALREGVLQKVVGLIYTIEMVIQ